ncbi:MAG: preprotein translocase subunit Sec61beta [Candidatus Diapherotrites archaeon]|uniref:Preprotein translocase subunit Sec61beta n=1 Tax=Candidatus Iainarchaeum sp. TaxID=3101447 RepID=A0A8T3YL43_9ARCH|nr:preprotein translocase subunit Sec61beta [Candidatus Diapherotrites archaeon]
MKFTTSGSSETGPSSSIGIMRFDTETGGPKISPEFVVIVGAAFTLVILVLQLFKV